MRLLIDNDEADVYIVNFANCDMVGHTGDLDAAIKAVEAVDSGVGAVVDAIRNVKGEWRSLRLITVVQIA